MAPHPKEEHHANMTILTRTVQFLVTSSAATALLVTAAVAPFTHAEPASTSQLIQATEASCGDSFGVTGVQASDVEDPFPAPGLRRYNFRVNLVDINRFLNGQNGTFDIIAGDSNSSEFFGPFDASPSGGSAQADFTSPEPSITVGAQLVRGDGTLACSSGVTVTDPRTIA